MILDNLKGKKLILASGSPRRADLLKAIGFDFEVFKKDVDESFDTDLLPWEVAEYLAHKKSDAYADEIQDDWILITADTLVSANDRILNKPENRAEALDMIQQMRGKSHEVVTGVCLRSKKKMVLFHTTTLVSFSDLSDQEIEHYVDTFKPFDKAGAYGIQEWIGMIGVTSINGSFQNVVGLPTQDLYQALKSF